MKLIEMQFWADDWRLIAAACARVSKGSLIDPDGSKQKRLKELAHLIATETGKDA